MTEELKGKYHLFTDVWNTGNLSLLAEIFSADAVYHMPPFPDMNLDALGHFVAGFRKAFPDFHVTFDEEIIAGDTTVHRWTWQGTFTGESPVIPAPPNGKHMSGPGCSVVHWSAGKAVEAWHHGDWLGALQQIGVIPPLENVSS
ncbi:MAG: ester cyclase [Desulfosarcinaceae bacterium]|nr:ester cyclase [Desulfosarcinaceae bacterium]